MTKYMMAIPTIPWQVASDPREERVANLGTLQCRNNRFVPQSGAENCQPGSDGDEGTAGDDRRPEEAVTDTENSGGFWRAVRQNEREKWSI